MQICSTMCSTFEAFTHFKITEIEILLCNITNVYCTCTFKSLFSSSVHLLYRHDQQATKQIFKQYITTELNIQEKTIKINLKSKTKTHLQHCYIVHCRPAIKKLKAIIGKTQFRNVQRDIVKLFFIKLISTFIFKNNFGNFLHKKLWKLNCYCFVLCIFEHLFLWLSDHWDKMMNLLESLTTTEFSESTCMSKGKSKVMTPFCPIVRCQFLPIIYHSEVWIKPLCSFFFPMDAYRSNWYRICG